MARLLLLNGEDSLSQAVQAWADANKHVLEIVSSSADALAHLRINAYDLVILALDDFTNILICKQYRITGGSARIIVLGNSEQCSYESESLDSGADDYLSRPWRHNELLARMRALLRRPSALSREIYKCGSLILDTGQRTLLRDGKEEVHLMPKEYQLLEYLVRHQHNSVSSEQLMRALWKFENATPATVRTYIKTLRKKVDLQNAKSIIKTTRGLGYRISSLWRQVTTPGSDADKFPTGISGFNNVLVLVFAETYEQRQTIVSCLREHMIIALAVTQNDAFDYFSRLKVSRHPYGILAISAKGNSAAFLCEVLSDKNIPPPAFVFFVEESNISAVSMFNAFSYSLHNHKSPVGKMSELAACLRSE